jgi:hypothetical protein
MSIWAPKDIVGWEDQFWGFLQEKECHGGEVRTYAQGFSNHYPTTDDVFEKKASIELAEIPAWCVPGHTFEAFEAIQTAIGPWLRLCISDAYQTTEPPDRNAVVMDEKAVEALRDQLNLWLECKKIYPLDK